MRELSKTQLAIITVAGGLLFYTVGVATGLFGLHIFSTFFIISKQTAHDIAYATAVTAIALIIMTLTLSSIRKTGEPAQADSAGELRGEASGMLEEQRKTVGDQ